MSGRSRERGTGSGVRELRTKPEQDGKCTENNAQFIVLRHPRLVVWSTGGDGYSTARRQGREKTTRQER